MRTKIIFALSLAFCLKASSASVPPDQQASITATFSSMPLSFTENQGQWPDSILYRASAGGATMWFTPSGAYYQFSRRIPGAVPVGQDSCSPAYHGSQDHKGPDLLSDSIEILMIKAEFVGANLNPPAVGLSRMEYKRNYFIGNEPDKWRTNVSNYESIQYQGVYPGIDLKYYGNGKQMEYDFIVSPGADYTKIQIRYDGAESLSIGQTGELIIKIANGEIIEQPPIVYQTVDGRKEEIGCNYVIGTDNSFSFEVDSRYNPAHELVIDPILVYSTYLGGFDNDIGVGIKVDGSGAAYVMGSTNSPNFPTLNPYQTDQADYDVFVTKLSSDGSSLIYSTYLGGSRADLAGDIAVNAAGAAYLTGYTLSTNFPTLNPFQNLLQGGTFDAFVAKLSSSGDSLVYSTYIGGNSDESGYGIAVDAVGAAYVTGTTNSTNFPTLNPYQTFQGLYDAFVIKLSSSGSSLVYGSYLGGSSDEDYGDEIAVDTAGAAYVSGSTRSTDFPTHNPYQADQGGNDVFVTKLNSTGDSLVYSTYLGGSSGEICNGMAVDAAGAVYVVGQTYSTDFPTLNPYQPDQVASDAFVTKLNSTGNGLVYSTYLGGSSEDAGFAITVNAAGVAYVTGNTFSTDFPTLNPDQTYQGTYDATVTILSSTGSNLVYSSYLGGNGDDYGNDIAVDAAGAAYVVGQTFSADFPTLNPYQTDPGIRSAFIAKLSNCCIGIRGDVNGDAVENNVLDLTYMINDIFRGGPSSVCPQEADLNSDGTASNVLDLTYLINDIYRGGPSPALCQ